MFRFLSSNGRFPLFVLVLFTCLPLVLTPAALAKTFSVPESSPTIKGAMIKAQPGDIILVSCGTYYEHDITLKPGVALWSGTLQPGCVTIDARGKGRIFRYDQADTNTALVGFTVRGGKVSGSGGAVLCINSSPRISNCLFQFNEASSGAAVAIDSGSHPQFTNCRFENNTAFSGGGAFSSAGQLRLKNCAFEGNQALIGGALLLEPGAQLTASSCSFQKNEAGNTGGGLHLHKAKALIVNSIFANNWGGLGGAAFSSRQSDLTLEHCTLFRNGADTEGAVLALDNPTHTIKNCIIAYSRGEILRADSQVPRLSGCNLFGNEGGDWVANLRPLAGQLNNISQDPMFCSPEYGNFTLHNSSACLPVNNPSGNKGIVGALGAGCATADPIENPRSGT